MITGLALELSAFFAVKMEDFESFRHHMNQLKVYYFDYASLLKESNLQNHLLGLHLMSLLTSGDFSEFHVELERIPYEKHDNPFISFPLSIEQEMMEGSYHRIVTSVRKLPAEETYKVFMKKILHTVRYVLIRLFNVVFVLSLFLYQHASLLTPSLFSHHLLLPTTPFKQ